MLFVYFAFVDVSLNIWFVCTWKMNKINSLSIEEQFIHRRLYVWARRKKKFGNRCRNKKKNIYFQRKFSGFFTSSFHLVCFKIIYFFFGKFWISFFFLHSYQSKEFQFFLLILLKKKRFSLSLSRFFPFEYEFKFL